MRAPFRRSAVERVPRSAPTLKSWLRSHRVGEAAEKLAERFSQSYVPPTRIARLYTYADEGNAALQWLEKAYVERDFEMVYLDVHPDWENLRSDPRFQDLVRRMNFPKSSA